MTSRFPALSILAASALASLAFGSSRSPEPEPLAGGASATEPAIAEDLDPDPNIVRVHLVAEEVSWEIAPGKTVQGYGYNGTVPGPTILAEVGQTVVIDFDNHLPEDATIHWHGLRVPAVMDGTPAMMRPVEPGGHYTYFFKVKDAGTFWYHPHANEAAQMERGLMGAFVVTDPSDPQLDDERVLVFDDLKLDRSGEIEEAGGFRENHEGREGEVTLLNGQHAPVLHVPAGQKERWRILNAGNARYLRLSVGGQPFEILASDGGLLPGPRTDDDVILAPSDRVDLVVGPFREGTTVSIDALPYDRGFGEEPLLHYGDVVVGPQVASRADPIPTQLRDIPWLAAPDAAPDREVVLSGRMTLRGVEFLVDGEADKVSAPARVGDVQVWDVTNATPVHHPFHLHGFFFQVLSVDGVPRGDRSLQDTADLPPSSTTRIAWIPDDRTGTWMFHCHIMEHAVTGMMSTFEVAE